MAKEIPNSMDLFNKVKKMGKNIVNRMDFVYCFIRAKSNFVAFNILKLGGTILKGALSGWYEWIREIFFGEKGKVNYV